MRHVINAVRDDVLASESRDRYIVVVKIGNPYVPNCLWPPRPSRVTVTSQ